MHKSTLSSHPPLIVLLGPTAVGKTELSLSLCQQFDGEVVSADSRQVYRQMDIGTAKPSLAERALVPHHLFDIRDPDETLSLAEYQRLGYKTINAIHAAGNVPFLVGGSVLYIRSIVEGLRIPEVPPNVDLRAELEAVAAANGWEPIYERLLSLDPATAAVIDKRNTRRVIRAIEIFLATGVPKVEQEGSSPPPYRILVIGLDRARENLYSRIDQRVDQMVAHGLLAETQALLDAGYNPQLSSMSSLGYREMIAHLRNELPLADAVTKMKTETHRFVRHQYTWFRKLKGVQWFNVEKHQPQRIIETTRQFLTEQSS